MAKITITIVLINTEMHIIKHDYSGLGKIVDSLNLKKEMAFQLDDKCN